MEPPPITPWPEVPFRFYLGTHRPNWLATANVPLFISASTLNQAVEDLDSWAINNAGSNGGTRTVYAATDQWCHTREVTHGA